MLYGAELWSPTVAQKKKLEAAHHKFHRRMMGISYYSEQTYENPRQSTV